MVSLRDGKTYEVDATPSKRRTARRSVRRESTAVVDSEPADVGLDDEPQTPLETASRGFKRNRTAQQVQVEVHMDNAVGDTDTCDQDAVPAAAPSPSSVSPSALPKKKQRTETRAANSKKWNTLLCGAIAVAVVAVLAVVLRPYLAGSAPAELLAAIRSGAARQQMQHTITHCKKAAGTYAGSTVQLLQEHAWSAQQHMFFVLQQLHVKAPSLVPPSLSGMLLHTADSSSWSPEVLYKALPTGDRWRDLASDIAERLRTPAPQRSYKAAAFILACGTAEDCSTAADILEALPPRGAACSLRINASRLAEGTNQASAVLQATLAPFLKRCPTGLVLLLQAEQMPAAALPALHNALSEQGGFQYNGAVDSSRSAYALLMHMPVQHVLAAAATTDTGMASEGIKDAFINAQRESLQQQIPQQHDSAAGDAWAVMDRALKTLHRRIDFAAPVRFGKAAQLQLKRVLRVQKSTSFDDWEMQTGLAGAEVENA